ncbi:MAG TPA: thiamine ABC transporter substrate binding subunit [Microvirga sp.]|jgi:thiamine transport system substrate-binding protein|nr:thiamine ABC transporter substrate binding subunit [Microvirga sp.]
MLLNVVTLSIAALAALAGPALAQPKPSLTVYTYSSFAGKYGPGKPVEERFEAVCGCDLVWVTAEDTGTLLGRLRLEGETTRADVVLGLDMNLAAEARATGLFAAHGQPQPQGGYALPVAWTDDLFIPFDWGHYAFVYDETRVKTPPASLKELVENPKGPTVVIQDPRTSAPGLGLLLWMRQVYGERAGEAWAQLKPRIVTVTKGWSEAYGLFLKGEADMVLSYATSPAYHIGAEGKRNYRAAAFAEGHYLHVELAGMTRTAKQPDLARRFLAFVLSDAFQAIIPETNWMVPVTVPAGGLPASFADLIRPEKTLIDTPEEIRRNRRALTDAWLNATAR